MQKLNKKIFITLSALFITVMTAAGCGNAPVASYDEEEEVVTDAITIGFSQLGAESDWRSANSESMRTTFSEEKGYDLLFEDGQQKQQNQITAIRTFIQRGVDYIVLAPVTEEGWDTVLGEAKAAGIPVILVDRDVNVEDESLYVSRVGSDFELEGKKACAYLKAYCDKAGISDNDIHIVNIQGTIGSSAQIGRTKGLRDAAARYGWDLKAEKTGDFTQAKGREVTESLLRQYPGINVIYCENDNEALGAIEAVEAAGKKVGSDILGGEIMIISFDGVRQEALELVKEGKISAIAECNPDLGPKVEDIILSLEKGENPQKTTYVDEAIYTGIDGIDEIEADGETYKVTLIR